MLQILTSMQTPPGTAVVVAQHGIKLKASTRRKISECFQETNFPYFPMSTSIGSIWSEILLGISGRLIVKIDADDEYKELYLYGVLSAFASSSTVDLAGYSGSLVNHLAQEKLYLRPRLTSSNATKLMGGTLVFKNDKPAIIDALAGKKKEIDRVIESFAREPLDLGVSLDYTYKIWPESLWDRKSSWLRAGTDLTFLKERLT